MEKVSQFVSDYRKQIIAVAITTLIYQVYHRVNEKSKLNFDKLHEEFTKLRGKKFREIKNQQLALIPRQILDCENSLIDEVKFICGQTSKIEHVQHLIQTLKLKHIPSILSPLLKANEDDQHALRGKGYLPRESFVYKGSYVLSKNVYTNCSELSRPTQWLLAGPRKFLYFEPSKVKAAIVTCGGLCPGLNVVIRQIFINLNIHYGVSNIWGIPFGFKGIYSYDEIPWVKLDMNIIRSIQFNGGTFLGSSRGGFDKELIVKALVDKGINQLYVIGGDGTHKGIHVLNQYIKSKKLQITIVGVPKTIDNDIPIIDKSFGFETSVSESIRAIRSAYVESIGAQYGIGLVRLMGRQAGFIAMQASNSSRDVDLCLIPQAKFDINGEHGVLEYVYKSIKQRKNLVIVVAEGAGLGVQDLGSIASQAVEVDESNNRKMPDIGQFLKKEINRYCKEKKISITLKYIDPTYMIRTVAANSHDVAMCADLAACAVHGAMAGYTGFTVGHVNQRVAMIPVDAIFNVKNRVDVEERAWQRVLAGTGQPSFQIKKRKQSQ